MVGLGGGEQDLLDPPAAQQAAQPAIATGAKSAQHIRHGAPQVLNRLRPLMHRAQHIDQHDLAVDPGEMIAEERLHDLGLIAFITPRHLAPQTAAQGRGGLRQRGKRQHRTAGKVARQQKAPRRAIRPATRPRRRQIGGEGGGKALRPPLIQPQPAILGPGPRHEISRLWPPGDAVQRRLGPLGIAFVQQPKVQQPFAGIIDDIQMQHPRPGQTGQKARRPDAKRQPQLTDRPRRLRPMRIVAGHCGKVVLIGKARQGQIGLRLQIDRLDPPRRGGAQLRHPPVLQQVGDQPGDEHRLARP